MGVCGREVLVESGVVRDAGSEEEEGLRMALKSAADEERCIWTTQKINCPTKSIPYRGVNHPLSIQGWLSRGKGVAWGKYGGWEDNFSGFGAPRSQETIGLFVGEGLELPEAEELKGCRVYVVTKV